MKVCWSLSGMFKGVHVPFDFNSPEFREMIIGKPVYLDSYKYTGRVTDIDVENDMLYAEIPDAEYTKNIVDSKGLNLCSFEIVEE